MAKPILYGLHLSPPVRSVLLVAKAIGLDLEFREVNLLTGEHKKPEFLEKNPQHTVPTLDDGGLLIWDSHAIATYLIGKYGKDDNLYPKDLYKRALVDQRLHFDSGILFVRLRAIFERIIFFNETTIPQERLDALNQGYEFMDKFLAASPYLVGDSLTVADLCCIASISSTQGVLPVDKEKYPNLAAWMKRMEELPYYEEANGKSAKELIAFINSKIA
ncbi:glutathione S-transferase 1-like [Hermetia illucens]|uniref:glutathione S-transferase 1-like n=1 Tax=Hermetia illucens TaxID=343691 RepID=UPI0018CC0FFF|nr:glutathione S-transferase 1-like [Hermetia illucens]